MKLSAVRKLLLLFVVATILLVGWNLSQQYGDGELHVAFLDIRQADSCVIAVTVTGRIEVETGYAE